jgi:hypothetical protein
LIAGMAGTLVGIDEVQVDLVMLAVVEVGDHLAGRTDRTVGGRRKDEVIGAGAASQLIRARPTGQRVFAGAPLMESLPVPPIS